MLYAFCCWLGPGAWISIQHYVGVYKANILEHYPRRLMAEMDDGKAFDIYN